ncbi:hypothetical protein LEP1GSC170_3945 [Leptospira interrogans serovar Bataviae str. HAI135]|nr:hypothetical protein LEP1GSC170_3945 [Leptospira interrogans serovar Bataviae str. HAI135]
MKSIAEITAPERENKVGRISLLSERSITSLEKLNLIFFETLENR